MLKRLSAVLLVGAFVTAAAAAAQQTAAKPRKTPGAAAVAPERAEQGPRPEHFIFPPLAFTPPKAADYRAQLSNGLVVYLAEDHAIPWFEAMLLTPVAGGAAGFGRGRGAGPDEGAPDLPGRLRLSGRGGSWPQGRGGGGGGPKSFLEPADKLGIQDLTASVMRTGGTTSMSADQINERMEFLAGSVSPTSLSIHMRHLDEGLRIWLDILTSPAFPEDRLRRERQAMIAPLRNRNRNLTAVASDTWGKLIYGEASPVTAEATEATINSITRDDVVAWHRKYWGANNAMLVAAGDFTKAEMLRRLEATFGKWRASEAKAAPAYPVVPSAAAAPGVYMVQPLGVTPNQGIIRVGTLSITQDDPDFAAVDLMNYTLGGGSFSSRITQIVRNDYGLAYTANSSVGAELHYPGAFAAFTQTKNATVVFATQLILNELERMHAGDITEKDLAFAKTARLNAFPPLFSGALGNAANLARLEFDQRPRDYYDTYLERYRRVTLADVRRVAKQYLQPDKLIVLVTGNIGECKAGADTTLPNQDAIDAMAAKYGGRTLDGLAKALGGGTIRVLTLK
ncbi:MAG TPA: pitrilysin family protein [Vicinamibacterales bacterium]|nr:pitrilysin family protein [Vicinamibacterales bacterium]HPW20819.1 pitrilysin family protein [Vicinamibacterales bacterium]